MYQALTLSAGVAKEFYEVARFFRLLAAPGQDIQVIFYNQGREIDRADNVGAGYAERFDTPFDKIAIKSTAGGAVAYVTRMGSEVRYDTPPQGQVVINASGAATNTNKTVTTTSASLLAANASRKYLLVQNKDAAGVIYISFGVAATAANGVKIPPGGSFTMESGFIANNQIFAIGDIASNANVVAVEA